MNAERIERGPGWTMHLADWRTCELPRADAFIEDGPYGARTHDGQSHARKRKGTSGELITTAALPYECLTPRDVLEAVLRADEVCRGWCLSMTSHDLIPAYEAAAAACKPSRYCFAPLPIVMQGQNVRMAGDGPSNWTVHLMVTRRRRKAKDWSTKPGAYVVPRDYVQGKLPKNRVPGGKPLGLMESIVKDYTLRGAVIVDRYAGGGTTGVAAIRHGRRFVGYEMDPERFEICVTRLRETRPLLALFTEDETAVQCELTIP